MEKLTLDDSISIKPMAAAALIGVSRSVMYELLNSGSFHPAFRIGRSWLINVQKLRQWVDEQCEERRAVV